MDFSLITYSVSLFLALFTISSVTEIGTLELQTENVPPALADRGYTQTIVTNQTIDSLRHMLAAIAAHAETEVRNPREVTPISSVAAYFGLRDLVLASQATLGLAPPKVQVEILQDGKSLEWRVRGVHAVTGHRMTKGTVPISDVDPLIEHLALETLDRIEPFDALVYKFLQDAWVNDFEKSTGAATKLLEDCQRYQAAVCTQDNLRRVYVVRGLAQLYGGGVDDAFEDLDVASRMGKPSALVLAFLGDAWQSLGDESVATRMYNRAVEVNPKIALRFYGYARGFQNGGHYHMAQRRFDTASRLGMDHPQFFADWGEVLYELGDFQQALEKFEIAVRESPYNQIFAEDVEKVREAIAQLEATRANSDTESDDAASGDTGAQPSEPERPVAGQPPAGAPDKSDQGDKSDQADKSDQGPAGTSD